ncbi:protein GlmU [Desulfosarcina sp.]|uniref:protein GlmU n=1 Tax=Desulfosarcina sp. TaxID=2027861 RepID=UPI0029AB2318|nr:protein GlmU [Desulfosarcina sp.]MDX2453350.1 protein GlmU [Desulfosarcina sp.]MDX2491071.1 protein GlmU [Desulfosarcina sp.]
MKNKSTDMVNLNTPIIGDEVDRTRIGKKATIHPGCRLLGSKTLICDGAELGFEAPVTVNNCYIGPNVKLKGGYFENAVFLEGAEAGSGAHVRSGTIFEEQASIAHTVGLKQTVLFPFVTLGSLINFCDCFMAGGTSRKNHSEVGSSYIHFNYTPNQDKATASLIGDVPNGVMLNQNPIFLGGQGGLVGPCRIAYGTLIAAGSVYRKDQLKPDRLVFEGGGRGGSVPYSTGIYRNVKRQAFNNIVYLANLVALMAWYTHIRRRFIGERFPQALYEGLIDTLHLAISEKIKRFTGFCEKLKESGKLYQQQMGDSASANLILQKDQLVNNRDQAGDLIRRCLDSIDSYQNQAFLSIIRRQIDRVGPGYIDVIKSLDTDEASQGTLWLQQIVDEVTGRMLALFPAIR